MPIEGYNSATKLKEGISSIASKSYDGADIDTKSEGLQELPPTESSEDPAGE